MALDQSKDLPTPLDLAGNLSGTPEEANQFDFLIGLWSVSGLRYDAAGVVQLRYHARWSAEYLHEKRMVLDDFTVISPSGEELSSFVSLRTYAHATVRWEIAGLAALQPGMDGQWNARAVGAEMHCAAEIRMANGSVLHNRERFHAIERNQFHWESHISQDGRATWKLIASLIANRVP